MTWNILGAILIVAIFSLGALVIWFVLGRANPASLRNPASAEWLRKNFRYFLTIELIIGAIVGWIVGPIIFEAMGVAG